MQLNLVDIMLINGLDKDFEDLMVPIKLADYYWQLHYYIEKLSASACNPLEI